jgi:hypothetical protein
MTAGSLGSSGRDKRSLSLEVFAELLETLLYSKISANASSLMYEDRIFHKTTNFGYQQLQKMNSYGL